MDKPNSQSVESGNLNEKYLEFIQSTISRMAQNSFQAKTWCITILTAIVAFYLSQVDDKLKRISVIAAFAVVIIFCAIDAYYLYLERGYRDLYSFAAKLETSDPPIKDYDMRIPDKSLGIKRYLSAFISPVTGVLYEVILALLIVLINFT